MDEDAATRKQGRPSERPSGIHAATTLPPGKKQHVRIAHEKEDMTERPIPTSAEHSRCRSVADLVQCLLFLSSSRSNAPSLHLTSSSLVQVESGKREVWGFSIPRAILNTLHHLDQLDLYPATCIPSDPKNKPKTLLSGSIFWAPSLRESTNIDCETVDLGGLHPPEKIHLASSAPL